MVKAPYKSKVLGSFIGLKDTIVTGRLKEYGIGSLCVFSATGISNLLCVNTTSFK